MQKISGSGGTSGVADTARPFYLPTLWTEINTNNSRVPERSSDAARFRWQQNKRAFAAKTVETELVSTSEESHKRPQHEEKKQVFTHAVTSWDFPPTAFNFLKEELCCSKDLAPGDPNTGDLPKLLTGRFTVSSLKEIFITRWWSWVEAGVFFCFFFLL